MSQRNQIIKGKIKKKKSIKKTLSQPGLTRLTRDPGYETRIIL
jgi:hypothetical protein